MTTMIALVGEQPQPNFLPVLQYGPNDIVVVLVYTARTQTKYENLEIALKKRLFKVYGIETDPYNITSIVAALNTRLTENKTLSSQPMIFNLTGGTKTMSLAAYQVAAQYGAPIIYLQSEKGQSLVDSYGWQDGQLCYQKQEQLNQYLDLHDMLNLHLGQGKDGTGENMWKEKGPNHRSDGGHLFEIAIATVLDDQHGYEVMCGVKDKHNRIEIDVMIRYQNQIGIIEAKTSATDQVTGLKAVSQLSTAMRYLGGTYIRQFLIINGQAGNDLQTACNLLHIPIISLPHYNQGADSLSQKDSETLLTEIDRVMKVGVS